MKYLKNFDYFSVNESQVLYSQNLVKQIMNYSQTLIDLPIVKNQHSNFAWLLSGESNSSLSRSLQLYQKKEFRVNANEILYQKDMITKGITIMREFLDYLRGLDKYVTKDVNSEQILEENIKGIIQGNLVKNLEDIWVSVIFIPFHGIENSIYSSSPREDVLGAFSPVLPDFNLLNYKADYSDTEDFCKKWSKLCYDGSLYKVRLSADIGIYYKSQNSWYKEAFKTKYDNLLRHELTHLTQFINSLSLKVFENCRDFLELGKVRKRTNYGTTSLRRIISEAMSEVLKAEEIKVGIPRRNFIEDSKLVFTDKNSDDLAYRKYYHSLPDEFKTWMSDQTRVILQDWINHNKSKWELAKSGDAETLRQIIDWVTKKVLSIEDVKLIPNENLKRKEIERLIKGIAANKM